jgi:hypothetical protein
MDASDGFGLGEEVGTCLVRRQIGLLSRIGGKARRISSRWNTSELGGSIGAGLQGASNGLDELTESVYPLLLVYPEEEISHGELRLLTQF